MPKGRNLRPAIMKHPRSRVPYVNRHSRHFPGRAATLQGVNSPFAKDHGRYHETALGGPGDHSLRSKQ